MTRPARRALPALLATLLVAPALAACGSDDEPAPTTDRAGARTPLPATDDKLRDLLPADVRERGTLELGALWETPPVIGVTASDTSTPVGIAPDLATAIGGLLGLEVSWQNLQWPAQLPGVQSGSVDALFGQVTATAEREQAVVDLVPFLESTFSVLLTADAAEGVTGLADLCGTTLAVPVGSVQGAALAELNEDECAGDAVEIAEYQGATLAISAVKAGSADGWIDNTVSTLEAAEADSSLANVELAPSDLAPSINAIAVSKESPELTEALVGALRRLAEEGTYGEVLAAHGFEAAAIGADALRANPITGTAVGATARR
ncbi:transporter substrate-binding domain-containing protein [Nocardioides sp. zg-DK7169]|uniref:transporter substrate-binding domain-containing protein n=1 Tax=Nocardioides sp. zg-DK7169 TaxID=2736600 RepID=UPI0015538870|nr:transporter substrate-binding domain-containing protein [Nocardioides sp. zg-DK7169]NPC98723.1 transporter substrate-binding domain-containing protein [Nocardioides sp. zg-DK7169]